MELFDEAKKAADASLNDDVWSSGPEVTRCVDSLKQLRKFKVTSELLVSTQVILLRVSSIFHLFVFKF